MFHFDPDMGVWAFWAHDIRYYRCSVTAATTILFEHSVTLLLCGIVLEVAKRIATAARREQVGYRNYRRGSSEKEVAQSRSRSEKTWSSEKRHPSKEQETASQVRILSLPYLFGRMPEWRPIGTPNFFQLSVTKLFKSFHYVANFSGINFVIPLEFINSFCLSEDVAQQRGSSPLNLSFIHSFTHSFLHAVIPSIIHSFIRSLIDWFTHSLIHSVTHAVTQSFSCPFVQSFTHSLNSFIHLIIVCSLIHSRISGFILSLPHSLIHPLIHWFSGWFIPSFM